METNLNGETTSLAAAQHYTDSMASAANNAIASIEQAIAHMQARGVSGPALAAFAQASEMASGLAAQCQAASGALSQQQVVKEAYAAAPGAGDKEFVTGE